MAGTAATPIPAARQVAYLMRTYLLNAAAGVKRVYWYAYDMGTLPGGGTLGNTLLTDPTNRAAGTLTPAGRAFPRIRSWMAGTLVGPATKAPVRRRPQGHLHLPGRSTRRASAGSTGTRCRTVKVTLVRSATSKVTELGRDLQGQGRHQAHRGLPAGAGAVRTLVATRVTYPVLRIDPGGSSR